MVGVGGGDGLGRGGAPLRARWTVEDARESEWSRERVVKSEGDRSEGPEEKRKREVEKISRTTRREEKERGRGRDSPPKNGFLLGNARPRGIRNAAVDVRAVEGDEDGDGFGGGCKTKSEEDEGDGRGERSADGVRGAPRE
ncbi:hypothetical protein Syun_003681 [Stephania yunnanensis]|uniref:Uncharacterized protein n=1 Tax=Stephania yunnanensis TaxID=152371 RepID=A0AAP0L5J9_9MAGN